MATKTYMYVLQVQYAQYILDVSQYEKSNNINSNQAYSFHGNMVFTFTTLVLILRTGRFKVKVNLIYIKIREQGDHANKSDD